MCSAPGNTKLENPSCLIHRNLCRKGVFIISLSASVKGMKPCRLSKIMKGPLNRWLLLGLIAILSDLLDHFINQGDILILQPLERFINFSGSSRRKPGSIKRILDSGFRRNDTRDGNIRYCELDRTTIKRRSIGKLTIDRNGGMLLYSPHPKGLH